YGSTVQRTPGRRRAIKPASYIAKPHKLSILTGEMVDSHFNRRVSFDTITGGEPTDKNSLAFTLNIRHKGYQYKRRSRTFMVGVGENEYSEIALQWMLEELVDDGDEIICVRVIDKDAKVLNDRNMEKRQYQIEAKELLERIEVRNDNNRAVSIVLEFVAGKLHATFQRMIQMYEPVMLIVGTKGRSLGGLHGLMSNRNSFSKWCLQYSPIPVVVVRPTSKRLKKKKQRDADPTRQDYARILRESGIEEHETETASHCSNWEISNAPEVEAHAVAAALGLPAKFEPKLKPIYSEVITPPKLALSEKAHATASTPSQVGQNSQTLDTEDPLTITRSVSPSPAPSPTQVDCSESKIEDSLDNSGNENEELVETTSEILLVNDSGEKSHHVQSHTLYEEDSEASASTKNRIGSVGSVQSIDPNTEDVPATNEEKSVPSTIQ
ncbi:BgTH12-02390, partial [Blumeria graminis f. sp. triticale]